MTDYCKTGSIQPMVKTIERYVSVWANYPNVGRNGGTVDRLEIESGTIVPQALAKRLGIKSTVVNGRWEKASEPYLNGTVKFYRFIPEL